MHAAVEPASTPRAAQQKVNEQTQRLLELFDNDTEHRSELDASLIAKYLQREYHGTLSEGSSPPFQPYM